MQIGTVGIGIGAYTSIPHIRICGCPQAKNSILNTTLLSIQRSL